MLCGRFTTPQKKLMLLFTFSYSRKSFIRTNCLFIFIQTGIHDDAGTLACSCLGQYHVLLCTEQKRLVLITNKTLSSSV